MVSNKLLKYQTLINKSAKSYHYSYTETKGQLLLNTIHKTTIFELFVFDIRYMILTLTSFFPVPSPPADIKVAMSSANKIVVSWLPPDFRNGELVAYTFYMGIVENGKEVTFYWQFYVPNGNVNAPLLFVLETILKKIYCLFFILLYLSFFFFAGGHTQASADTSQ